MHPLDGPRLKIVRAKSEIDRLNTMDGAFRESTKFHIVKAEFNPKSQKDVYRVRVEGPPPPPEWGLYIGEIAHNLRSALNHLVYQLALLQNKPEIVAGDRTLQFPIFLLGNARSVNKMIKLLRPEYQARIKQLQPSNSNNPLYWLNEINNTDKHRLLQVVASRVGIGLVMDDGGHSTERAWVGNNIDILTDGAIYGEADPDMRVNATISPVIVFAYNCDAVATMGVCYVLELIANRVSEIVESFASEF